MLKSLLAYNMFSYNVCQILPPPPSPPNIAHAAPSLTPITIPMPRYLVDPGRYFQLWHDGNKRTVIHKVARELHRKQRLGVVNTALLAHQLRTLTVTANNTLEERQKTAEVIKNQQRAQQKQQTKSARPDDDTTVNNEIGISIVLVFRHRKTFFRSLRYQSSPAGIAAVSGSIIARMNHEFSTTIFHIGIPSSRSVSTSATAPTITLAVP